MLSSVPGLLVAGELGRRQFGVVCAGRGEWKSSRVTETFVRPMTNLLAVDVEIPACRCSGLQFLPRLSSSFCLGHVTSKSRRLFVSGNCTAGKSGLAMDQV